MTPRYTIESKKIKVTGSAGQFTINPTSDGEMYNILQPGAFANNYAYPAIKEVNPTSTDNNNEIFYQFKGYWGMSLDEISYITCSRITGSRDFIAIDALGNPVSTGTDIQVLIVKWVQ
jgi:hypothetical protein